MSLNKRERCGLISDYHQVEEKLNDKSILAPKHRQKQLVSFVAGLKELRKSALRSECGSVSCARGATVCSGMREERQLDLSNHLLQKTCRRRSLTALAQSGPSAMPTVNDYGC